MGELRPPSYPRREVVAVVHGRRRVAACIDADSIWVEITGPNGGGRWPMAPERARQLAGALNAAAARTEALDAA